ncbi:MULTISPECIES: tetratricopeptide repeat protein [Cyanophyceae]|uniref:tetratricopeptide repeat protein n=1 Tax=Cyanophyceae TaxID=3028117 RepID=UPI00016DCB8C|nr:MULTISPECIES: tetratricopeptide repeat protein [Cyanophyceae]ACA99688.1 TPR-repeat containing protein [Picosynechococcus sp. PCC 7002]SMH56859.1 Tetratricopeptide repeat-containing protein [Picosynechococcus sp. OG1]SMQ83511.1 Tetratricopeptide repeat-containing protein [Synechococcus sp. 7002]
MVLPLIAPLIGGVLSGVGLAAGKTLFDKFTKKNSSSITPATPVAIEKDDRYQKLLQQYVIQQEKREAELKQLVFASTKMQGQMILQEEKWKELNYQQQQQLIDNAAQHNQRIAELKAQELEQVKELEQLKLSLMEQWHREKFSQQNRQILQQWDLSNWNSKLNREETEDLLQPKEFKHRLLTLVSRPKIVGNDLFCLDVLHEQIKSSLFDLNEHIPRSELEVYCDYFKSPIEDTDIPRVQKILNSIPTLILSTKIIRNRIYFSGVFWGMGDEENIIIQPPAWDMSEIFKQSDDQEEAILQIEETISYIQKILIVYIKDLYFLSFNFYYEPTILSNEFQNIFSESIATTCESLKESLRSAHAEQIKRLKVMREENQSKFNKNTISKSQIYDFSFEQKHASISELFHPKNIDYLDGLREAQIDQLLNALVSKKSSENDALFVCLDLGLTHYDMGKYEFAITDFSKAISLDPNDDVFYRLRGDSYYCLKKYSEAIEDYGEAIRLNKLIKLYLNSEYHNCSGYYNMRGVACYRLEKYTEALQDFENALRLNPQNQNSIYLDNKNQIKKIVNFESESDDMLF